MSVEAEDELVLLRVALLRALHKAHPYTLNLRRLALAADLAGFGLSDQGLLSCLTDMVERGWLAEVPNPVNAAQLQWKRTEAGRLALVSTHPELEFRVQSSD